MSIARRRRKVLRQIGPNGGAPIKRRQPPRAIGPSSGAVSGATKPLPPTGGSGRVSPIVPGRPTGTVDGFTPGRFGTGGIGPRGGGSSNLKPGGIVSGGTNRGRPGPTSNLKPGGIVSGGTPRRQPPEDAPNFRKRKSP